MRKARRRSGLYPTVVNPLAAAWTELITTSGQIALASGRTIMHRMLMMSTADFSALTSPQRREFTRMYTEKVQAAAACGQIMAVEMMRLNQQFANLAWSQFLSSGTAMTMLGIGKNPSDMLSSQSRFAGAAARRANNAAQNLSATLTRAAVAGLKPVHTRVSANAKRLGRKKR